MRPAGVVRTSSAPPHVRFSYTAVRNSRMLALSQFPRAIVSRVLSVMAKGATTFPQILADLNHKASNGDRLTPVDLEGVLRSAKSRGLICRKAVEELSTKEARTFVPSVSQTRKCLVLTSAGESTLKELEKAETIVVSPTLVAPPQEPTQERPPAPPPPDAKISKPDAESPPRKPVHLRSLPLLINVGLIMEHRGLSFLSPFQEQVLWAMLGRQSLWANSKRDYPLLMPCAMTVILNELYFQIPKRRPFMPYALILSADLDEAKKLGRYFRACTDSTTLSVAFLGPKLRFPGRVRLLKRGVDIAVATLPEAAEHIDHGSLSLHGLKYLVVSGLRGVDPAEEISPVGWIRKRISPRAQTSFFSASDAPDYAAIAELLLGEHFRTLNDANNGK